jgi:hypothetical protein
MALWELSDWKTGPDVPRDEWFLAARNRHLSRVRSVPRHFLLPETSGVLLLSGKVGRHAG